MATVFTGLPENLKRRAVEKRVELCIYFDSEFGRFIRARNDVVAEARAAQSNAVPPSFGPRWPPAFFAGKGRGEEKKGGP